MNESEMMDKIFNDNLFISNLGIENHADKTTNLRQVIQQLKRGGYIDTVSDNYLLIEILERYFNHNESYTKLKLDLESQILKLMMTKSQEKDESFGKDISGLRDSSDEDKSENSYISENSENSESEYKRTEISMTVDNSQNPNKKSISDLDKSDYVHKKKSIRSEESDTNPKSAIFDKSKELFEKDPDVILFNNEKDKILSQAANRTMGYEMIKFEFVELMIQFFMNKYKEQLEDVRNNPVRLGLELDKYFKKLLPFSPRKLWYDQCEYNYKNLPPANKDKKALRAERLDRYDQYTQFLLSKEDELMYFFFIYL